MATASKDVVIIGGGHNGLVAATYLAKAGKSVVILEANEEIGGATASVRTFAEFDARLSRYSYLVALLPDQIVSDLGLNFATVPRKVSSYTPDLTGTGLYIAPMGSSHCRFIRLYSRWYCRSTSMAAVLW